MRIFWGKLLYLQAKSDGRIKERSPLEFIREAYFFKLISELPSGLIFISKNYMDKGTKNSRDERRELIKKARKKYFSFGLARNLAETNTESPLFKSYKNSLFCADTITVDPAGLSHSHYCKNRWCPLCQSIRVAKLINGYKQQLERMGQLYFVTLTRPTVLADQLNAQWDKMSESFKLIRKSRVFQRSGWSGLRKVECTIRPNDLYHLHYHVLIDSKEGAEYMIRRWLELNPESDRKAQDIRKVDGEKGYLEIFKYFTKLVAKIYKSNSLVRYIDYARLDVIFQFMRGKRVFQPFGELHPVQEDFEDDELDGQMLEQANTVWKWMASDWFEVTTGESLTGYDPSNALIELLNGVE